MPCDCFVLFMTWGLGILFAQSDLARFQGYQDPSGARLPARLQSAQHRRLNVRPTTNDSGYYIITNVPLHIHNDRRGPWLPKIRDHNQ